MIVDNKPLAYCMRCFFAVQTDGCIHCGWFVGHSEVTLLERRLDPSSSLMENGGRSNFIAAIFDSRP